MRLESRVAKIEAGINVAQLSPEQVARLDITRLTLKQVQALNVSHLTEGQMRAIDFDYLTNKQLEAICAMGTPEERQWYESLSDEELQAVVDGRLKPPVGVLRPDVD